MTMGNGATLHEPEETKIILDKAPIRAIMINLFFIFLLVIPPISNIK